MPFPQYLDKHKFEALINPEQFVKYAKYNLTRFPKKYIITYQGTPIKYFKRKYKGKYKKIFIGKEPILVYKGIGLIKIAGIGAPNAVTTFEELISLGGKYFINVGTAGGLEKEGIFLCDKAIRDEGTSHHYLPNGTYSYPSKKLTNKLAESFSRLGINAEKATTWTIDAPYRETKKEIEHYKSMGARTVEMEASALFAVAQVRKVNIASAFVVSDVLGEVWDPKFFHLDVKKMQKKLVDVAMDCLDKL